MYESLHDFAYSGSFVITDEPRTRLQSHGRSIAMAAITLGVV